MVFSNLASPELAVIRVQLSEHHPRYDRISIGAAVRLDFARRGGLSFSFFRKGPDDSNLLSLCDHLARSVHTSALRCRSPCFARPGARTAARGLGMWWLPRAVLPLLQLT